MKYETLHEMSPREFKLAAFQLRMAMAVNRLSVPDTIVTVRAYDGESEAEALSRHGLEDRAAGPGITFVHLG